MALGTLTQTAVTRTPLTGLHALELSFAGDGAYPAGGTAAFQAYVRAKTLDSCEVLAVIPIGFCGGYVPVYDKANDKLMMLESDNGGADGPLQESTTANLSGVTLKLLVLVK